MTNGTEQLVAAQRALLDTAHNVGLKALEGATKLMDLNVQAARATLSEATTQMKSMLEAEPTKLFDKGFAVQQPSTEKATAYAKHAYEIFTTTNGEIAELLQKHVEESQDYVVELMDAAAKNAPAGSETVFAAAKNSLAASRNVYEQALGASRKIVEMAEQGVSAATKAATPAAIVTPRPAAPAAQAAPRKAA